MLNNKKWFTFVELIISITIIVILWAIWFSSYIWYISDSRDSQRKSDLSQISSSLKIYKQKRWYYWNPWDYFNITYSWTTVALQWKLNTNVHIDSLEKLPLDPDNQVAYSFSITTNKQEFELAATLENGDFPMALLTWNYKTVSKNILPTLTLAKNVIGTTNAEIKDWMWDWSDNRKLFVYDKNKHNLVYTFEDSYEPYSDSPDFNTLLQEAINNNTFWQNSDYRNCVEIKEAWKLLLDPTTTEFEYQIIDDSWLLTVTWCTISNTQ